MLKKLSDTDTFKAYGIKAEDLLNFDYRKYMLNVKQLSTILDRISRNIKHPMMKDTVNQTLAMEIIPFKIEKALLSKVLEQGNIPVYLSEFLAVPRVENGTIVMYVDFSPFDKIYFDNNNDINGDLNIIYSLLQNALVYKAYLLNHQKITTNYDIIKSGTLTYVKLFSKLLDKMFAIKNDVIYDQVNYLIAKFFLINLIGKDNDEQTSKLALTLISNQNSMPDAQIRSIDNAINDEKIFTGITTFIQHLSTIFDRFGELTMRKFTSEWSNAYGIKSVHAMNHFAYLLMVCAMAKVGTSLLTFFQIDTVASPYYTDLYDAFYKIM